MRVALVSYEFPPDTAFGGIATYVGQMARCLAEYGMEVEVFCGSEKRNGSSLEGDVLVHRVKAERLAFRHAVLPVFWERHVRRAFDLIEGPDYFAEASEIAYAASDVPYVVKLHTPYYFVQRLNRGPRTVAQLRDRLRLIWYVLKTRDFRSLFSPEREIYARERANLHEADEVVAPSHAVARAVNRIWHVSQSRMSVVPLVFEPPKELLDIPIETETRRITYIGRLEQRKGVLDLALAIPAILRQQPDVLFRFVGSVGDSPDRRLDMRSYIYQRVPVQYHDRLEFTGGVSPEWIAPYLSETDICIFPSRWESFGFVVLEAMAAGRAVVCTGNSGMAEIVDFGEYGLVVPPQDPAAIAKSALRLLENPTLRYYLGTKARAAGLQRFTTAAVAPLQIKAYERAIARRMQKRAPRRPHLLRRMSLAFLAK
ncbi:MAG: glycosyltransferase family 4 protein [Nibricoccus sp.]